MGIWAAVKYALNSTLGTNEFTPLDVLIKNAVVGGIEEYISFGSYTFTVPAGVTKIKVTACGAGAGGCGGYYYSSKYSAHGGNGGGGGAAAIKRFDVIPGDKISITVGKGGTGADGGKGPTTQYPQPTKGGNTIIGNLMTLAGGNAPVHTGSTLGTVGTAGGTGGGDGGTPWGSVEIPATAGKNGLVGKGGTTDAPTAQSAGGGGGGSLGNGGNAVYNSDGGNGTRGGGGAGGSGNSSKQTKGGNGGDGYVKIEWGAWAL